MNIACQESIDTIYHSQLNAVALSMYQKESNAFQVSDRVTVSQWAEDRRILQSGTSRQPGPWSNSITPYLKAVMDRYNDPHVRELILCFATQIGKALHVETPILTTVGWKKFIDIKIGDIVYDENGEQCSVIDATPVVFGRDCFEITFSDKTKIITDADHNWIVTDELKYNKIVIRKLTTKEISSNYKNGKRNRYVIPVAMPIKCEEKELPIDPYVLGVWLGDGHSYSNQITITESDLDIAKDIEKAGYKINIRQVEKRNKKTFNIQVDPPIKNNLMCKRGHLYSVYGKNTQNYCRKCASQFSSQVQYGKKVDEVIIERNDFSYKLLKLGLLKTKKNRPEKHIPKLYLISSYEQRLSLLQGLMDTDGYINKNHFMEFSTTSKRLAEDFEKLVNSLGIKCTIKKTQPHCKYNGNVVKGKIAHKIKFLEYREKPCFRLKRKLEKMVFSDEGVRRISETKRRRIINIEKVNSVPVRCIAVNSKNHLYLAGTQLVPTHNTESLYNILGYIIDEEPYSTMLIYPREDDAKTVSRTRVQPMLEACDSIRNKIPSDKDLYQMVEMHFPGMVLYITGANSSATLSQKSARNILRDEVDKWPDYIGKDADPRKLSGERAKGFWDIRKFIDVSSPILDDKIWRYAHETDEKNKYYVPCPICNHFFVFNFHDGVKFENNSEVAWPHRIRIAKDSAYYECPECKGKIEDRHKPQMLLDGKWINQSDYEVKHAESVSYFLNSIYSPWLNFGDIVEEFLKAIREKEESGKLMSLQNFINGWLGEPWIQKVDMINDVELLEARTDIEPQTVPGDCVALICSIDVQKLGFYFVVRAWARDYTSYLIHYGHLMTWEDVENLLFNTHYPVQGSDEIMRIVRAGIDTGGGKFEEEYSMTEEVYNWLRRNGTGRGCRVWGTKGSSGELSGIIYVPKPRDKTPSGKPMPGGLQLIHLDTNKIKDMYMYRNKLAREGSRGGAYLNKETGRDYAYQILAEEKIKDRHGVESWERKKRDNHYFDCEVINMAVADPEWPTGGIGLIRGKAGVKSQGEKKQLEESQTENPYLRGRENPFKGKG